MFATTDVYETRLEALQNAVDISFILPSRATVNFFVGDSYYQDNVGGVSLKLSSNKTYTTVKAIPETASVLGLLAVGTIALSTRLKNK